MARLISIIFVFLLLNFPALAQHASHSESSVDSLLLKNYQPESIYKFQENYSAEQAKYPVIDMHSHPYPKTEKGIKEWVQTMAANNIKQTTVLTYATGAEFDSLSAVYSKFGNHFNLFCGIDFTGYEEPGFAEHAIKELERLHEKGAAGIGELGDKGEGLFYSHPTKAFGMHLDDKRMDPILEKAGELGMPINVHVAEPYWFYMEMDSTNDGLMNALNWRLDNKDDILGHDAMLKTLENAVRKHPNTTFVAAHLGNSSNDLRVMGRMFDKYPNLYADVGARYAELSQIPRHVKAFITKYQDRIVYGTDMGTSDAMYDVTFRILETMDEHFYEHDSFGYHWSLNGFNLDDEVLEKIYSVNPKKILNQ